jgi:hypothetical protein
MIQRHSLSALEKLSKSEDLSYFHDIGADVDLPISMDEALEIAVDNRDLVDTSKAQIQKLLNEIKQLPKSSFEFEMIR